MVGAFLTRLQWKNDLKSSRSTYQGLHALVTLTPSFSKSEYSLFKQEIESKPAKLHIIRRIYILQAKHSKEPDRILQLTRIIKLTNMVRT